MSNNAVNKYVKQVKSIISFNSKDKKEFITMLKKQVYEYCDNKDNCTYENIIEEFGTPNETAGEYIQSLDSNILLKNLKKRHFIMLFISICIFAVIVVSAFEIYRLNQLYEEAKDSINGYYETTIEQYNTIEGE